MAPVRGRVKAMMAQPRAIPQARKIARQTTGFKQGGAYGPLRGTSGSKGVAKAFRGKEGFKESQKLQKKLQPQETANQKIDARIKAQQKKQEIKNKEAREEWAEVSKLGKKLKTGAKIAGAGIGTTIVAGKVKQKLKKKKDED